MERADPNSRIICVVLTGICMTMTLAAGAQPIKGHRWKDRVLLILAENPTDVEFRRQVLALTAEKESLAERIGAVYRIFPNSYGRGLAETSVVSRKSGSIHGLDPEKGFGLLLIGLDGSVKLRSENFVAPGELWGLIDSMPMRRAEIRKKGKNN